MNTATILTPEGRSILVVSLTPDHTDGLHLGQTIPIDANAIDPRLPELTVLLAAADNSNPITTASAGETSHRIEGPVRPPADVTLNALAKALGFPPGYNHEDVVRAVLDLRDAAEFVDAAAQIDPADSRVSIYDFEGLQ